jgi:hypothetical protein
MWRRFQQAWMNYVALQDIDYVKAFQCRCSSHPCRSIIADGILLGVHQDKVCMRSDVKGCSMYVPCAYFVKPLIAGAPDQALGNTECELAHWLTAQRPRAA